jgi:hypothetical protein
MKKKRPLFETPDLEDDAKDVLDEFKKDHFDQRAVAEHDGPGWVDGEGEVKKYEDESEGHYSALAKLVKLLRELRRKK